jgi:hypothetical protein
VRHPMPVHRYSRAVTLSFRESVTTIYRIVMEETRWEAVSPGSEWSIPLFRADFPTSSSKSVQI